MKVQMASFSSNQAQFNLSTALACKPFRSEGLIGMDAIGHGRVVFDFPRNKVNFDSNESNDTLNFVFDTGTDNRIFLSGKIGGQIIRILWDTGGGLKSEQHRISGKALELSGVIDKQILQKSPRSFLPLMNLVISNADGSKKSLKLVRCIEDLEIGPIKTKNLIFAVDDLEKGLFGEFVAPGTNMILGYPAMSNYQWIFDFNEKTWSASK